MFSVADSRQDFSAKLAEILGGAKNIRAFGQLSIFSAHGEKKNYEPKKVPKVAIHLIICNSLKGL